MEIMDKTETIVEQWTDLQREPPMDICVLEDMGVQVTSGRRRWLCRTGPETWLWLRAPGNRLAASNTARGDSWSLAVEDAEGALMVRRDVAQPETRYGIRRLNPVEDSRVALGSLNMSQLLRERAQQYPGGFPVVFSPEDARQYLKALEFLAQMPGDWDLDDWAEKQLTRIGSALGVEIYRDGKY